MDLSLEIRRQVFIQEQGVDPEEEIDNFDDIEKNKDIAIHVLVFENNQPIAKIPKATKGFNPCKNLTALTT